MTCRAEIHVGDIGTIYRSLVVDQDGNSFDPSDAIIMKLIFKMPNGVILWKDAVMTDNGSPATQWWLEYQVQPGDGIGSPGEFHDNAGLLEVEGYLEYASGYIFHSQIITTDEDGQELRIFENLANSPP
jgi:hypothetical protein